MERPSTSHPKSPAAAHTRRRTPGTSQYGLAPMERGLSLVQCPYMVYEATTTGAAWRARVATASAVARSRAHQAKASCVLECHTWHVAARSCADGERRLAGAVPSLYRALTPTPRT